MFDYLFFVVLFVFVEFVFLNFVGCCFGNFCDEFEFVDGFVVCEVVVGVCG